MHSHAPHAHAPHRSDDAPGPRRSFLARIGEPEMLVGLSAILLSVCGLGVSIYEANLERHYHYAQVWPHVEVGNIGMVDGKGPRINMVNSGIGPAVVRTVEITVDGKPQTTWSGVMRALLHTDRTPNFVYSNARTRVLRPGDELDMLVLPLDSALIRRYYAERSRLGVRVCYASVFEQHWTLRITDLEHGDPEIREAGGCDEDGPGAHSDF
jgi:hypothetical protein